MIPIAQDKDPLRDLFHRRNREEWLLAAQAVISRWFQEIGYTLPEIRISVGFKDGTKQESHTVVGCTYPGDWADDGLYQVYMSPITADVMEVLDTLVHENVHVLLECRYGHSRPFQKIAHKIGLTGKMIESVAGPELHDRLGELAARLGDYPHSALRLPERAGLRPTLTDPRPSGPKRQRNKQLRCACPVPDCPARRPRRSGDGTDPYAVRTTLRWITVGLPRCPFGHEMEQIDRPGE